MRTALIISVVAHIALWGPLLWVGRGPLPALATDPMTVELVSPDAIDEAAKAQEPPKPNVSDDAALAEKADPQSAPSPQRQEAKHIRQPGREVPAQSERSTSAASGVGAEARKAEADSDQSQSWGGWIDSPLMTASVGFDAVESATKLSPREIAAFKARLQECWKPPPSLADAKNVVVVLRASFAPNGALKEEPTLLAASASQKGPALMETAMRALGQCQPYRVLPAAKYKEWKRLDLSFSPAGLSDLPQF